MAQAPIDTTVQEQVLRTRRSAKRLQNASRAHAREMARLDEMLGKYGIGLEVIDDTTTAREGEGDQA